MTKIAIDYFDKIYQAQASDKTTVIFAKFKNNRDEFIELCIPICDFKSVKNLKKILLTSGFDPFYNNKYTNVFQNEDDFCDKLSSYRFDKTYLLTPNSGWYCDKNNEHKYCYVLPNKTYGYKDIGIIYYNNDNTILEEFEKKGTFEEFYQTLDLCRYSKPLILTVGVALSSFLIKPLKLENYGIHLFGTSSIGKSTIAKVASSIMGAPNTYISWRMTDSGVEDTCIAHSDRLIVFDEAKLIDKDKKNIANRISDLSYFICAGVRKKRSQIYAMENNLNEGNWHFAFISTGEFSIRDNASSVSHVQDEGEKLRFIDVPAQMSNNYGIFSKIPQNYKSSVNLVEDILERLHKSHGHLGIRYIKNITKELNNNYVNFTDEFNKYVNFFCKKAEMPDISPLKHRFTKRFGIAFASLILANKWKLIPWSKKLIFQSVRYMYELSLNYIKSDREILEDGLKILRLNLDSSNKNVVNLAEYKSSDELKLALNSNNYIFYYQKDSKKSSGVWLMTQKTFNSLFVTDKQFTLVRTELNDIIPKTKDGYALHSLGHKVCRRMVALREKDLRKLL